MLYLFAQILKIFFSDDFRIIYSSVYTCVYSVHVIVSSVYTCVYNNFKPNISIITNHEIWNIVLDFFVILFVSRLCLNGCAKYSDLKLFEMILLWLCHQPDMLWSLFSLIWFQFLGIILLLYF